MPSVLVILLDQHELRIYINPATLKSKTTCSPVIKNPLKFTVDLHHLSSSQTLQPLDLAWDAPRQDSSRQWWLLTLPGGPTPSVTFAGLCYPQRLLVPLSTIWLRGLAFHTNLSWSFVASSLAGRSKFRLGPGSKIGTELAEPAHSAQLPLLNRPRSCLAIWTFCGRSRS